MASQTVGHPVRAVALGDGAEVEHDARGLFDNLVLSLQLFHLHLLITHQLSEAVELLLAGHLSLFESESPGVDQRGHGDVEGPVRLFRHLSGEGIELAEHPVQCRLLPLVDGRHHRLRVEGR